MQPQSNYPPPTGGANPAMVPGIVVLVCAAAILAGTLTKSWFGKGEEGIELGIGLTSMKMCMGDRCESESLGKAKVDGDIVAVGWLALIGGLASAAACAAAGGLALSRKLDKLPAKPFMIVLAVTAGAMAFFLVRMLTAKEMKDIPISYSGIIALAGVIVGGVFLKQLQDKR